MRTTIKRQLLYPFAAGLALLAVAIGVGSVVAARGAANEELQARATRADALTRDTVARTRERLVGDAPLLGRSLVLQAGSPRELENAVVRFSVDRDLSHLSVLDAGGRRIGGDGRVPWARLPLARRPDPACRQLGLG